MWIETRQKPPFLGSTFLARNLRQRFLSPNSERMPHNEASPMPACRNALLRAGTNNENSLSHGHATRLPAAGRGTRYFITPNFVYCF